MKKKTGWVAAGLGIGSMLMVSSVFAGVSSDQGYEAYKSAIQQSMTQNNETRALNLTLTDNGSQLVNIQSLVKSDDAADTTSAVINVSGKGGKQVHEAYGQGERTIVKLDGSSTYYLSDDTGSDKDEQKSQEKESPVISQRVNKTVDALVGNLKTYFIQQPGAGDTSVITADLSGEQIPAALNAVGSLLILDAAQPDPDDKVKSEKDPFDEWDRVAGNLPELTSDVRIDNIALSAVTDPQDGIIKQHVTLKVSGQDNSGAAHKLVLSLDLDTMDIGTTVPDQVDLTNKTVQTVE